MAKPTPILGLNESVRIRDVARQMVATRLADAQRFERGAAAGDEESVHDLRVATRRLRAAFDLVGADDKAQLRLKELQDALGAVRDRQLLIGWFAARKEVALVEKLSKEQGQSQTSLKASLLPWQRFVRTHIPRMAYSARGRLGGHRVRDRLRRQLRRLLEEARRYVASRDSELAHQTRIRAKKLRYSLELLEPIRPRLIPKIVERLAELQGLLGDLHDIDVRLNLADSSSTVLDELTKERARLETTSLTLVRRWIAFAGRRDILRLDVPRRSSTVRAR